MFAQRYRIGTATQSRRVFTSPPRPVIEMRELYTQNSSLKLVESKVAPQGAADVPCPLPMISQEANALGESRVV